MPDLSWTDEDLLGHLFGELDPARDADLRREAAASPGLRRRLDELAEMGRMLGEVREAEKAEGTSALPERLREGLLGRARSGDPKRAAKAGPRRRWSVRRLVRRRPGGPAPLYYSLLALGVAASLVLAILLGGGAPKREAPDAHVHGPSGVHKGDVAEPAGREAPDGDGSGAVPDAVALDDGMPAFPDGRPLRAEPEATGPEPAEGGPSDGKGLAEAPVVEPLMQTDVTDVDVADVDLTDVDLTDVREATRPSFSRESLGHVSALEGDVECARADGDRWLLAHEGTGLSTGDRVRTRRARARIAFESGSVLYVDHFTTLTLSRKVNPPGLSMVGGAVYVETVGEDGGFWVETPHGRAVDRGTRFGVEARRSHTTVLVVEGEVEASTDVGKVRLGDKQKAILARRTSPPEHPREARDLARRLAWVGKLKARFGTAARGLLALYLFDQAGGESVHDVSRADPPLDLEISGLGTGCRWVREGGGPGGLFFVGTDHNSIATSGRRCPRLFSELVASDELTIEVWIRPATTVQQGPARIVVYEDPSGAAANAWNCQLEHGGPATASYRGSEVCFRLRTSSAPKVSLTTEGGRLSAGTVYHVACTYRPFAPGVPNGGMRIYVNGELQAGNEEKGLFLAEGPNAWDPDAVLSVGNRYMSLDRDWHGTIFLAAVYSRALSLEEIRKNMTAGPRPSGPGT